jgi:predicted nucleic-acid-binding protein
MIGLDTNILVQFLLRDNRFQAKKAADLLTPLSADESVFVSAVVLVELVWVLRYVYQISKAESCDILKRLAKVRSLQIEHAEMFFVAVRASANSSVELTDHFIAGIARAAGCSSTFTFDRAASRTVGMTQLM